MPRANRYFIAGQIYHLTHRCHDRRFLFNFARDRNAYRLKLREAAEHFKVSLLDYCLTRNHVHLLACADTREGISAFMQMAQGQFAQSYNRRRRRTGAFWEDRYLRGSLDGPKPLRWDRKATCGRWRVGSGAGKS